MSVRLGHVVDLGLFEKKAVELCWNWLVFPVGGRLHRAVMAGDCALNRGKDFLILIIIRVLIHPKSDGHNIRLALHT